MNQAELSTFNNASFWQTEHVAFGGIAPIDHLFNRLDGIYVGKWRAAFSNDSSIKNWRDAWSEAIVEEKLTPQEIKEGIKSCRRLYDWPPSFAEFFKACRPELSYECLFYEAVEQMRKRRDNQDKWTNAAVYHAAVGLGNDLSTQPYQNIKGRWKSALDRTRELISEGKLPNEVPERKIELPAPGKTTTTKEEARKKLAEILGQFKNATIA